MRGINRGNMNSARLATATAVTFTVAFAPLLWVLAEVQGESIDADCSGGKTGPQNFNVKKANTTLALKCDASHDSKVKPAFNTDDFKVCTDPTCSQEQQLSVLINGAKGTMKSSVTATIEIKQLPLEEKVFYVQCGEAKPKACYIVVYVASSKPAAGGNGHSVVPGGVPGSQGGVTSGGPLSCANAGEAITIKIPEKGSTAQFTCGDLTLYPVATERVFAEDCKKEESLKNIVRSVKDDVYTLTADGKPPRKKWCYLCAKSIVTPESPGKASDYCLVHVESSSRTQSSSSTAVAATLLCVLAMLRIT